MTPPKKQVYKTERRSLRAEGWPKMEKTRFHLQALGLALKGIFSTPGQADRGQSGATPMPMHYARFSFFMPP